VCSHSFTISVRLSSLQLLASRLQALGSMCVQAAQSGHAPADSVLDALDLGFRVASYLITDAGDGEAARIPAQVSVP
jgi:hypothetical protein